MRFNYGLTIPYTVKSVISPTIVGSTGKDDSTTFTATVWGDNYTVTIQTLSGTVSVNPTGVAASTTVGWFLAAGESMTIALQRTATNPTALLSLYALSTTDKYQAFVYR